MISKTRQPKYRADSTAEDTQWNCKLLCTLQNTYQSWSFHLKVEMGINPCNSRQGSVSKLTAFRSRPSFCCIIEEKVGGFLWLDSFRQEHFQLSSTIISRVTKIITAVQLVLVTFSLMPPLQCYGNRSPRNRHCRVPQPLWSAGAEVPVGKHSPPVFWAVRHEVICIFSKQRGRDWEKEENQRNCLTNPNEYL